MPEERQKLEAAGELRHARQALRAVLKRRVLARGTDDEAWVDGCTDLSTLDRWLDQAIVATTAAEALR